MPSESAKLFRAISVEYRAPAGATATVSTDLPGDAIALRATLTLPESAGRRVITLPFVSGLKGRIFKVRISGPGVVELYAASLYARRTGTIATDWQWVPLHVAPQQEWATIKLPITPTPDTFTALKLPIPPTPDTFSPLKLNIEPSSEDHLWCNLPMDR